MTVFPFLSVSFEIGHYYSMKSAAADSLTILVLFSVLTNISLKKKKKTEKKKDLLQQCYGVRVFAATIKSHEKTH